MHTELKFLLASKFIIGIVSGFLLVGLPLYLSTLGFSLSESGYVYGIALICYAGLMLYLGSGSEVSGRRGVGILAFMGLCVSLAFFGISAFVPLVIAGIIIVTGKIILNFCEGLLSTIARIRVLDLSNEKRFGSDFGLLLGMGSIGFGIGMLIGSVTVERIPYPLIFFLLVAILLLGIAFFNKSGDIALKKKGKTFSLWNEFWKTSRKFKLMLLLNTVVLSTGFVVDFFALPLYQKEILEMSDGQIFLLMGAAWVLYGVLTPVGGRAYDSKGTKIFVLASLLMGTTSILLAFAKNVWLFSAILVLDYLFFAFADPTRNAMMGKVSQKNKGMLTGFFMFSYLFVSGVLILFFGAFVNALSFEAMFFLRGIGQFGGILLLFAVLAQDKNKFARQQNI